jgi:ribosome-associated protein
VPVKSKTAKPTTAKPAAAKQSAAKKPAAKKSTAKPVKAKAAAAPAKKTVRRKPATAKTPAGMPEKLRDAALKVLDERQAKDILTVDLHGKSALADYIIIASGGSSRQLAAIADYLREAFGKLGVKKFHAEGLTQGDWVLIDAGDVLIHLFRPEVRQYYQIEDIWGPTPTTKSRA